MLAGSSTSPIRRLVRAAALGALAVAPLACASKQVSRIDPATVTDLSGRWNDTDSRLVANALIEQSLGGAWARAYAQTHGGEAPTVIVGRFANRSMDHIPVGTFVKDLENAYVSSGSVRVVASRGEREELRAERSDQQQNARAETRTRVGQEQGARYVLQGELQSIEDGAGREKVVYYQVDATIVDLESNAKVWVGQHRIKKYIERKRFGI
ncbi:MAG: penicillin-binding protein activator LpoB [Gemmatimonadaceae bacterium]